MKSINCAQYHMEQDLVIHSGFTSVITFTKIIAMVIFIFIESLAIFKFIESLVISYLQAQHTTSTFLINNQGTVSYKLFAIQSFLVYNKFSIGSVIDSETQQHNSTIENGKREKVKETTQHDRREDTNWLST